MDAATLGVVGTLGGAVLASVAAFYGHRISRGNALVTGYSAFNADLRQERAELRQEVATLKAELAAERAAHEALKAENTALRVQITAGGTP